MTQTAAATESRARTYGPGELRKRYEKLTTLAVVECTLTTELVGGAPLGEEGVKNFVEHHLRLKDQEAADAVRRILEQEGVAQKLPTNRNGSEVPGEVPETLTYGLTGFRHSERGAWIGNWQIKAMLKQAATRTNLFVVKRGSKGDLAELGEVVAAGASLMEKDYVERVHLYGPDDRPAVTYWTKFKGRISGPSGYASIVTDKEAVPRGTRFRFALRYGDKKISESDILDLVAVAQNLGIGSAKAYERGKFQATVTIG